MFSIFDENGDDYIDLEEFLKNVQKVYSPEFEVKMKLVFNIYDTDKDKALSKDEVILVLSHAPIKINKKEDSRMKEGKMTQNNELNEDYWDRVQSQKELQDLINLCFEGKEKLTFDDFKEVTNKISSEMFVCMLSLIETHFPSLAQFRRYDRTIRKRNSLVLTPKPGRRLDRKSVV